MRFIDLFCGAGGATTGIVAAFKKKGVHYEGVVVNHWDVAIQTHILNHPEVTARCAAIEDVIPDEIFADNPRDIDIGWASPTCTHHSCAAGGRPRSNQLRSQPELLLPYLRLTKVKRFFVENVPEFINWGPLLDKDLELGGRVYHAGQADPRKTGVYFTDWIRSIRCSDYRVNWQVLNAADYGAPTARRRLIVQMVREGCGKIVWPEPTHSGTCGLFGATPWVPARTAIDLTLPTKSIFARKKALSKTTMDRIRTGIKRYWGDWTAPFLAALDSSSQEIVIDSATPPIGAISPFVNGYHGGDEDRAYSIDEPLRTITTCNQFAVVQPFIVKYYGAGNNVKSIDDPLPTITTVDRFGLVSGRIVRFADGGKVVLDIGYRMLTSSELARAMTFPDWYQFAGTDTDKKKQIGNAVCPILAERLISAVI